MKLIKLIIIALLYVVALCSCGADGKLALDGLQITYPFKQPDGTVVPITIQK